MKKLFLKIFNKFKKKPLPFFLTNLLLSFYYTSKIDIQARIYYPSNLSLGRNVQIDKCVIYAEGKGVKLLSETSIGHGALLNSLKGHITIGRNTAIGPNVVMYGEFGLDIGNDCLIASNSALIASNNNYNNLELLINRQGTYGSGITIRNNIWIGNGSTILDGVELNDGCVVGAMSFVNRSFKKNSVIFGIPAKFIRYR